MKTHPTQFDVREIAASPRPHDLRPATDVHPNLIRSEQQDFSTRLIPPENQPPAISENQLDAASRRAAIGERSASQLLTVREVAELLQVPVSWIYGRMRKRSTERLPGYRLGKYWRFHEQEVLEWVQCHRGGPHAT